MLDGFEVPHRAGHALEVHTGRVAGGHGGHHVAQVVLARERDIGRRHHAALHARVCDRDPAVDQGDAPVDRLVETEGKHLTRRP